MSDPPVPNLIDVPSGQDSDSKHTQNQGDSLNKPSPSRAQRSWEWITGKHLHIREYGIGVMIGLTAVATMGYCSVATEQRDAMIEAVKESRRASNAAERAVEIAEQARHDSERTANETANRAERATKATENAINAVRIAYARSVAAATDTDITRIESGEFWVYVYVIAKYNGGGHRYFTEYYARYNFPRKVFIECGSHNDAN